MARRLPFSNKGSVYSFFFEKLVICNTVLYDTRRFEVHLIIDKKLDGD